MVWPIIAAESYVCETGKSMKSREVGGGTRGLLVKNPISLTDLVISYFALPDFLLFPLLAMPIKCARSRFVEPSLAFAGVVARPSQSTAGFMVDYTLQIR
jgi:hypothetical protein